MNRIEFDRLITEEFPKAIPEKFRGMIKNVAFLSEDEPSDEVRREEHLASTETLLGLYRGVPRSVRGDYYGVGAVVPDVIILYRQPITDEAAARFEEGGEDSFENALRAVIRGTMWHEVAHYLGIGENEVRAREKIREESQLTQRESASLRDESGAEEESIQKLFPKAFARKDDSPYQSRMEPIEVEKEDPAAQKALHGPIIPASGNYSSIDEEGAAAGMKDWWEDRECEKPEGLLPEDIPPLRSKDMPKNAGTPPKRGDAPGNLPTFEK